MQCLYSERDILSSSCLIYSGSTSGAPMVYTYILSVGILVRFHFVLAVPTSLSKHTFISSNDGLKEIISCLICHLKSQEEL